ncbi:MAG: HAMP domain-containing histidine kinase [Dehalococcoidales bacterium]|nr:HAMP domain-containing histidine kinase [Dehalococcoidales bacterium]
MKSESMKTECAPAERSGKSEILMQSRHFIEHIDSVNLIETVPLLMMALNRNRQIIYANPAVIVTAQKKSMKSVLGLRPGELFGCSHAFECEGGCGTTLFCSTCGALQAIQSSIAGTSDVRECSINRLDGQGAFEFRVWASPVYVEDCQYNLFYLLDISEEQRRKMLEHIFFHDIMNTASAVRGYSELLETVVEPGLAGEKIRKSIAATTEILIDHINAQKQLLAAESNELVVKPILLNSLELLGDSIELYTNLQLARGKTVTIADGSPSFPFLADRSLLNRVITNMLKNALEATEPGDTITLGCGQRGNSLSFWVENPGYIESKAQLQIFRRSFSTKGSERGQGTYSMRLLTEKYLNGNVIFTTSPEKGTRFTVTIPKVKLP